MAEEDDDQNYGWGDEDVGDAEQEDDEEFNDESDLGSSDEGEETTPKKFTEAEMVILLLYIGFTDLVGILIVCFALDDVGIIDILTFPVTQFYFRMKRVNSNFDLVGNVVEVIPYIGALPIRTIVCWMTMQAANNPGGKAAKFMNKLSQANPKSASLKGGNATSLSGKRGSQSIKSNTPINSFENKKAA